MLNSIASYVRENEQICQVDLFKNQTLMFIFHFQYIFHVYLSICVTYQQAYECIMQKTMLATVYAVDK